MKLKLLILLLIFSIKSYSQDSKFSIESNFPIPTGNNFIKENYSGIVDLGFKMRLIKTNYLNIGFLLNGSLFIYKENSIQSYFKNLYTIQPKILTELNGLEKFRPFLGLGYSLMTYRKTGSVDNGINFSLGINYNINKKIYLQIQYDVITGTDKYTYRRSNYYPVVLNSDINIIKAGIGYCL
jgi:hypothetical protein